MAGDQSGAIITFAVPASGLVTLTSAVRAGMPGLLDGLLRPRVRARPGAESESWDKGYDDEYIRAACQQRPGVSRHVMAHHTPVPRDAGANPPLQLECISSMSRAHGSAPVTAVYFKSAGVPSSVGRDGTLRSYAVSPAVAASTSPKLGVSDSAVVKDSRQHASVEPPGMRQLIDEQPGFSAAAGSDEQQQQQQIGTAMAAGSCPLNAMLAPESGAAQHAAGHAANGPSGRTLTASRPRRAQLLTCVGAEAVAGITAPILDITVAAAGGREERLVCGFQVRLSILCAVARTFMT